MFLKGKTTGYARYSEDINACRSWLMVWTDDVNYHIDHFLKNDKSSVPDDILVNSEGKKIFDEALEDALRCGSGFYNWRTYKKFPKDKKCDAEIVANFNKLKTIYKTAYPFSCFFKVPLLNIKKAFFKSQTKNINSGKKKILVNLLFLYRSLLLFLAIFGALLLRKKLTTGVLLFYPVFIYFYICTKFDDILSLNWIYFYQEITFLSEDLIAR